MTTDRELLEIALEALYMANTREWPENKIGAAINAISARIAEPDLAQVGEIGIWEGKKPMIDYAHPLIVLDDLLKEIHQLCIDKRYEEAMLLARESMYELSVLQCNLAVMAHNNV